MGCQVLKVQRLCAGRFKRVQQARLAAARGAHKHHAAQRGGQGVQGKQRGATVAFVATVQLPGAPTDHVEHHRHRARTLAAAPAVHQRTPTLRPIDEGGFQVPCDVARNDRGANARGFEGRDLGVQRADPHALFVVQHRCVDGAGDVVDGVLKR
ncbi:hypothetical protein D3C87_1573440 [compost metagenome]